jgi:hypothetical protein
MVSNQIRHIGVHRDGSSQETDSHSFSRTSKRCGDPPSHLLVMLLSRSVNKHCTGSCFCHSRPRYQCRGKLPNYTIRCFVLTSVKLPSAGGQFWTLTHKEARDPAQGQWSNVEPFIHIIKLDQINSRIHKTVFRVDKDIFNGMPEQRVKLDQKMATIRADLDKWIQICPQTPKDGNKITWMYDPESAYLDARDFYGV